jgi:hypothetical protein
VKLKSDNGGIVADQSSGANLSIDLGEDDLLGLQVLASLEGIAGSDSAGFADVAKFTLHRGITERFQGAGLPWPPTPDALETAKRIGSEVSSTVDDETTDSSRKQAFRMVTLGALAVALVVVLVGGYAGHWSWTGFDNNGQLWDWINLLLLPVAFGAFPLWLTYSGYMSPARRRALGGVVLAFVGLVLLGYLAPLIWTGFRGQTLWNWLTLLVLPITLATWRTWPTSGREIRRVHLIGAGFLGVGWIVTLIGGYAADWTWTGYSGNKLWDWVTLLLAPAVFSTFVIPKLVKRVSGDAAERAAAEESQNARAKALSEARARAGVTA